MTKRGLFGKFVEFHYISNSLYLIVIFEIWWAALIIELVSMKNNKIIMDIRATVPSYK